MRKELKRRNRMFKCLRYKIIEKMTFYQEQRTKEMQR